MPHTRHALNRRSFPRAFGAGRLDFQTEQLDALRAALDPVLAALFIVANRDQQILGDAVEFGFVDLIDQIVEPFLRFGGCIVGFSDRVAVQRYGDRSVAVLDLQDVAFFVDVGDVCPRLVCHLDLDLGQHGVIWVVESFQSQIRVAEAWGGAHCGCANISDRGRECFLTNQSMPVMAASVSLFA